MSAPTPSQTIGPFFSCGMAWMDQQSVVDPGAPGALVLHGTVLDGSGVPVPDALAEVWQAGRSGPSGGWGGFGRSLTDERGRYRFTAVKPGRIDDHHAPHIDMSLFARGLLQRLVTRVYFPDEAAANDADPVLGSVEASRRPTLVAVPDAGGLRFDIHLQGPDETVFFAW